MLVLAGIGVFTKVKKLGAVEADAFGPVLQALLRFVRELDISPQMHAMAVGGDCWPVAQFVAECRVATLENGACRLVLGKRGGIGLQDENAVMAVDDQRGPV